ncbi:unnamed protein product [Clonostachys chloroleuca]|uniref:Vegetative incompatibility protein HET-E-1 n=1 Tax=Clonostachys chloroleuca TaxID=1926264 RepID=A0AA35QFC4_9HYPO|nr:unnamed protein product [Clonostachys chloroleuca]
MKTGARLQHDQDCWLRSKLTFVDGLPTTLLPYHDGSFGIKVADKPEVRIGIGSLRTEAACLSHDAKWLAVAHGRKIRFINITSGQCTWGMQHDYYMPFMVFSHDSKMLAIASALGPITIWDVDTGDRLQAMSYNRNLIVLVRFSHNSALLAIGSSVGTIELWHTDTGKHFLTLEGHSSNINSIAFSHDSTLLASASDDMTIRVWDVDTQVASASSGHSGYTCMIVFSEDFRVIASGSSDGMIRVWDRATGKCLHVLDEHSERITACFYTRNDHSSIVTLVKFSADSNILVSASIDSTTQILGLKSDRYHKTLKGHNGMIRSFTLSNDSSQLVTGSDDNTAKLWDVESGDCIQTFQGHKGEVHAVAMSEDSKSIISACSDGEVRVWDALTSECRQMVLIPKSCTSISFRQRVNKNWDLITNIGIIPFNRPLSRVHVSAQFSGLGISSDYNWITFNGKKLLWLPAEVRPYEHRPYGGALTIMISNSTVAIGRQSRGFTIIGFKLELLGF